MVTYKHGQHEKIDLSRRELSRTLHRKHGSTRPNPFQETAGMNFTQKFCKLCSQTVLIKLMVICWKIFGVSLFLPGCHWKKMCRSMLTCYTKCSKNEIWNIFESRQYSVTPSNTTINFFTLRFSLFFLRKFSKIRFLQIW